LSVVSVLWFFHAFFVIPTISGCFRSGYGEKSLIHNIISFIGAHRDILVLFLTTSIIHYYM